jgi:hypothetical protein
MSQSAVSRRLEPITTELGHWSRVERSFVAERIRSLFELSPQQVKAQAKDLIERAPAQLLADELASVLYLALTTPESDSLHTVMHVWEAIDLPTRRGVRKAFEGRFGGSIQRVVGHRLPPHLKVVFSW